MDDTAARRMGVWEPQVWWRDEPIGWERTEELLGNKSWETPLLVLKPSIFSYVFFRVISHPLLIKDQVMELCKKILT